jgi:hypothetical protein
MDTCMRVALVATVAAPTATAEGPVRRRRLVRKKSAYPARTGFPVDASR